ncbi:hypothetical protein Baya_2401 [Bagarius yarrelli]|uniref:Uncharacterized protein n=1 Tax=Bagarius yarrelli TaxID=175774 RepID=A0A556TNV3_BAGYA|nr:hypothetical protein Baya_2401 [Bagarius yarrelli]
MDAFIEDNSKKVKRNERREIKDDCVYIPELQEGRHTAGVDALEGDTYCLKGSPCWVVNKSTGVSTSKSKWPQSSRAVHFFRDCSGTATAPKHKAFFIELYG